VKVEVRLFATLAAYLPPTSRQGVVVVEVAPGSTVRDVIRHLGIPADLERVSLVNGGDAADERPLQAGDVVTLFPPLAGGQLPWSRSVEGLRRPDGVGGDGTLRAKRRRS
jgi:molybdopterin converting factor small subunit